MEPEQADLGEFLAAFNAESDRGAALAAASLLDDRLHAILAAFFIESAASQQLLNGFNAPLGTFSARAAAAGALGLVDSRELQEITLIRRIRNEFGHKWRGVSFDSSPVRDLASQLPWRGPSEVEEGSTLRARFNTAVALLLVDLMWRARLVERERRQEKAWPNKTRT